MVKQININQPGDYSYRLKTPGEIVEISGRFKLTGKENSQVKVKVIHEAERTQARISLKATVDDEAKISIMGNVLVEAGATDTESFLEERVLLLSPSAKAEVVPNLEIMNYQVKCSHAAAVGKINEEQVFYLMSRGITEPKAKRLIAEGFLK